MSTNMAKEIAALRQMTVGELREKYVELFGEQSRSYHKDFLWKRLAWRMQALAEGDLSERARKRAAELANDADLRVRAPAETPAAKGEPVPQRTAVGVLTAPSDRRLPMPGAVLTREYKGQTVRVMVLDRGFEYDGKVYRSLSAIAKVVTGAHWSGYHFFGLNGREETE